MLWYVTIFISGVFIGFMFAIFIVKDMKNGNDESVQVNSDEVFNTDGTPRHITFDPVDLQNEL